MDNKGLPPSDQDNRMILDSWKEISSYLERSEKTCRKWEKKFGLPVHRMEDSPKARVYAYKEELDKWRSETLRETDLNQDSTNPLSGTRKWGFKLLFFIIGLMMTVFLLLLLKPALFKRENATGPNGPELKTLAVLPLVNVNGSKEIDCFADGMTDALITELARIGQLKVISRTSVMVYKNAKRSLKEIGKELKADCIVEGTIYCDGDDLRITVQLIDSKEDVHLWAEDYREQYKNIFGIQKKIALDIAENIAVNVTSVEISAIRGSRQINLKAYENFLRGTIEFDKTTRESLYSAIDFFQKSVQLDPGFARAYAWMGISHIVLAQMDTIPPRMNFQKAGEYSDEALGIDENCAEAIAVRGMVKWGYEWNINESEKILLKAISLSPSSAIIRNLYRYITYSKGDLKSTIREINLIRELDPNSVWNQILMIWGSNSPLKDRILQLEEFITIHPKDWRGTGVLTGLYFQAREKGKALKMSERGVKILGGHYQSLIWHAVHCVKAGDANRARTILTGLLRRDQNEYISPSMIAEVYAALGDADKAFEYLERAYKERDWWMFYGLQLWENYAPLRTDPRYDELVKKMGLKKPANMI